MDSKTVSAENRRRIQSFRLMDDIFMQVCFSDNRECVELVLRIILKHPDLRVQSVQTQKTLKNLHGRSLCLDIAATDSEQTEYDIEIQRADQGAQARRARYHSSLMDASHSDVGRHCERLPESYVIFITEHDVLKGGEALYVFERRQAKGRCLGDGTHIVYVNGERRGQESELSKLMHDFFCTRPEEMYFELLARTVGYYKQDERGLRDMNGVMEAIREEGRREGRKEGREKGRKEGRKEGRKIGLDEGRMAEKSRTASRMLALGKLTLEDIAEYTGLELDAVRALAEKQQD